MAIGISVPERFATSRVSTIAPAMIAPISGLPNQSQATAAEMNAKAMPQNSPTRVSFQTTLTVFAAVSSLVASARTATVSDWVPALPPMLATIGMRMARATACSSVASNRPMTAEARTAVPRLSSSQRNRALVVSITAPYRSSRSTPASRWTSSSASS